ncbi:hypothetical protein D4R51_04425 [bacterium]|nr:MAG: hypothetical protein D4R51_04425 [bacterium]
MNNFLEKIKFFLEKLTSKPKFDGLQISESGLEYFSTAIDKPRMVALRLPPGIFKNNKLQEPNQLLESLNKLHYLVAPDKPGQTLRVILVLPPGLVYTQSFNVPNVGEERLNETVALNIQMLSPIPVADSNISAQIIRETPDRYDLLGAFTDKNLVNQLKDILIQAHFSPIAFEFPALALTRLIEQSTKLNQKSTLVFQVSSDGLDFFILRDGHLYFNYFRSWQSIQGEERSISRAVFDGVVIEEVRKVINFSSSRFNDTPNGALIIAPGFEAEVSEILEKNFNLRTVPLVLNQISPIFYVASGAALRGKIDLENENLKIINLGGESLVKTIFDEQILNFISMWRNITVGVFVILLISFIFAASFLVTQSKSLTAQINSFSGSVSQKELADLKTKAVEFNNFVATIKSVRGTVSPWYELLNHLGSVASANGINIKSLDIASFGSPVNMFGTAPDYKTVFNFKNVLVGDPLFSNVNLPITQISIGTDNTASFNISFRFNLNR